MKLNRIYIKQQTERNDLLRLLEESEERIKALEQALLIAQKKLQAEQGQGENTILDSQIEVLVKK